MAESKIKRVSKDDLKAANGLKAILDGIEKNVRDINKGFDKTKDLLNQIYKVKTPDFKSLAAELNSVEDSLKRISIANGMGKNSGKQLLDTYTNLKAELGISAGTAKEVVETLADTGYTGNINDAAQGIALMHEATKASNESLVEMGNAFTKIAGFTADENNQLMATMTKIQQTNGLTTRGMSAVVSKMNSLTLNMKAFGQSDASIKSMVKNTTALASAMEKVGLSAETAAKMVDKLTDPEKITENIGLYAQLGISISDALNGEIDSSQFDAGLKELGQKIKDMGPIAGKAYAEAFGVSYKEAIRFADMDPSEGIEEVAPDEGVKALNDMRDATLTMQGEMRKAMNQLEGRIQQLGSTMMVSMSIGADYAKSLIVSIFKKIQQKSEENLTNLKKGYTETAEQSIEENGSKAKKMMESLHNIDKQLIESRTNAELTGAKKSYDEQKRLIEQKKVLLDNIQEYKDGLGVLADKINGADDVSRTIKAELSRQIDEIEKSLEVETRISDAKEKFFDDIKALTVGSDDVEALKDLLKEASDNTLENNYAKLEEMKKVLQEMNIDINDEKAKEKLDELFKDENFQAKLGIDSKDAEAKLEMIKNEKLYKEIQTNIDFESTQKKIKELYSDLGKSHEELSSKYGENIKDGLSKFTSEFESKKEEIRKQLEKLTEDISKATDKEAQDALNAKRDMLKRFETDVDNVLTSINNRLEVDKNIEVNIDPSESYQEAIRQMNEAFKTEVENLKSGMSGATKKELSEAYKNLCAEHENRVRTFTEEAFGSMGDKTNTLMDKWREDFKDTMREVAPGRKWRNSIRSGSRDIERSGTKAGNALKRAGVKAGKALKSGAAALKAAGGHIGLIFGVFTQLFSALKEELGPEFKDITDTLGWVIKAMARVLAPIVRTLATMLKRLLAPFKWFSDQRDKEKNSLTEQLKENTEALKENTNKELKPEEISISSDGKVTTTGLKGFLPEEQQGLRPVNDATPSLNGAQSSGDTPKEDVGPAKNFVDSAANAVKNAAQTGISTVASTQVKNGVGTRDITSINNTINRGTEAEVKALQNVSNTIVNAANRIVGATKEATDEIKKGNDTPTNIINLEQNNISKQEEKQSTYVDTDSGGLANTVGNLLYR